MLAADIQSDMRAGNLERALANIAVLEKLAPRDASVPLMAAYALRAKGDTDGACAAFDRALLLSPTDLKIRGTYASWLDNVGRHAASVAQYDALLDRFPNILDARIDRELVAAKLDLASAIERLRVLADSNGGSERAWLNLAVLYRKAGHFGNAVEACDHVLNNNAEHPNALKIRAQALSAGGKPSAEAFEKAVEACDHADDTLLLQMAGSLLTEGQGDRAAALIRERLTLRPDWVEGLEALAHIRWEYLKQANFADHYEEALKITPANSSVLISYAGILERAIGAESTLDILNCHRDCQTEDPQISLVLAGLYSEVAAFEEAESIFAKLDQMSPEVAIKRLRFLVQAERYEEISSETEAIRKLQSSEAWAYLTIAWRKLNDLRWDWLEGNEKLISIIDLPEASELLPALTERLNSMHQARERPLAQSVRGGTQTGSVLFDNCNYPIPELKLALERAVRQHIDQLPTVDDDHPLLSKPRDAFAFSGSWSVKLRNGGFHTNHIHSHGDLSSAFYVDLPDNMNDNEGWLKLGEPAADLNTGLPPLRLIEPKPGRLVLFPSFMWHGTVPFENGERLTCAFDVKLG